MHAAKTKANASGCPCAIMADERLRNEGRCKRALKVINILVWL